MCIERNWLSLAHPTMRDNKRNFVLAFSVLAITSGLAQAAPIGFASVQDLDFVERVISTSAAGARDIHSADLDGDGDMDVISAANHVSWYENTDGAGTFSEHVLSTVSAGGVYAADLDGDGDIDVLSAEVNLVVWYENLDGLGTFGSQEVVTSSVSGPCCVYAADLDGDGDVDVLSASIFDNKIAWYENIDGLGTFGVQQVLRDSALLATAVYAKDIDGDGDIDVLSASSFDDKIAWYENTDGLGTFGSQRIIPTSGSSFYDVYAADIDGDDDVDVLSASRITGQIAWHPNINGQGTFGSQQVISLNAGAAEGVYAEDLDRDGDIDVLSASYDRIAWHENTDGLGTFLEHVVSTNVDGGSSVHSADIDGDGDMDVLSASLYDEKIAWFENQLPPSPPSFSFYSGVSSYEDEGPVEKPWAFDIEGNGGTGLTFNVTPIDASVFSVAPAVDATTGVLTYTTALDWNGTTTLYITLQSDQAVSDPAPCSVTVGAVNDPPVVNLASSYPMYQEGDPAVSPLQGLTIEDVDDVLIESAELTISNFDASGGDVVTMTPSAGISQASNSTGSVYTHTLVGSAPLAEYMQVLDSLTYVNTGDDPTAFSSTRDLSLYMSDGEDDSNLAALSITLVSVNDPPSFVAGPDQQVFAGASAYVPGWASQLDTVEEGQVLTFSVSVDNDSLFSVLPTVDGATGDLSYETAPDANGSATLSIYAMDSGGTNNGGDDTSATQTATITVSSVNGAPSFTIGPDQTVSEDAGPQEVFAWASDLSAGPPNESDQTLTFTVTTDNDSLFSVLPTVDGTTGDLSYESAPDANGSATLSVYVTDNGGTADGGVDTSGTQTTVITVTAVNDVPSFTRGGDQEISEDQWQELQVAQGWAMDISAGPEDEAGQTLTFHVTTDNDSLFSQLPSIDAVTGDLSYEEAPDEFGVANLTITLMDNGGTESDGVDASVSQTAVITVSSVNDSPTFTPGPDEEVEEDAGPVLIPGWATNMSAGPPNESEQVLTFSVRTYDSLRFSQLPAVDATTGDLSFEVLPNVHGTIQFDVRVQDDGGGDFPNDDSSYWEPVVIAITPVNDPPSFTAGSDAETLEDDGLQVVPGWATGMRAGPVPDEVVQSETYLGQYDGSFGGSVSGLGDVNDDGYPDFLVGDSRADSNGEASGSVYLFSGADGTLLFEVHGDDVDARFGYSVDAAGDVNNDGTPDFVASATQGWESPNPPYVKVISGVDGAVIHTFYGQPFTTSWGDISYGDYGRSVSGVGDLNNDGHSDIVIGAPRYDDSSGVQLGTATVFSGADGSVLYSLWGVTEDGEFGLSVSELGDVSGDGIPDFIIGAEDDSSAGLNRNGSVRVFSGADASVIYTFWGDVSSQYLGSRVNAAGDVNNDGVPDIIVGAEYDDTAGSDAGLARVFSGADGSILYTFLGNDGYEFFGESVSGVGDVNDDGHADVAVGANYDDDSGDNAGSVRVFSGADGSELYQFNGDDDGFKFGASVSGVGDMNNDGLDDLLVGIPGDYDEGLDNDAGSARLFYLGVYGPPNPPLWWEESEQQLTFTVTTDNDSLFTQLPAIDEVTGELSYEAAPDANGVANLTVTLMDDGGTANGGVDASTTQTVTITVTPVNDMPSFTAGADQTSLEDAGPQEVLAWATALSTGPANEADQSLTFFVTTDNDSLFSALPTVDGVTGDLRYEAAPDEYGSATLSVYVMDDGGTDNGGVDTSAAQSVTITITPVNDVPSFTAGASQEIWEDAGPQDVAWATAMSAGPANEAHQTLTFLIVNDNPALFSDSPAIDAMTGELTYTVADHEHGVANLEVRIMDDGGTANGGVDTSDSQPLMITIHAVNDAPVMGLADGWSVASPDLHATGPYELFGSGVDDLDTRIGDGVESLAMVMEVALFAEHGVLSLPSAGGVTFLMGDGVEDRMLRFEGELPELNAALSHIEYRPDQFFGGFDRVFGSIDDRGWYGDGGPLSDDDMTVVEVKVPLGSATEFDVFGIGEVELLRSSAHGRIAAGEELRLHMFQAADVPFGSEQDVLISGGSITASQGAVYNGNAVYGTDAHIADSVGFFNSDHEPRQELVVVDFAHAEGDLEYRSASWGLVSPTGTAVLENDILHLTGSGRELNVFSIDREDLEAASTVQLSTPPGAFALLNINGGAVEHSHFGVLISGVDERSVLMNFYEAQSMVLYGTELAGSVLAPHAHVRVDALTVGGNLVADCVELVDGSAEGNRLAGEPWENTPWVMMMADADGEDEPGYTFTFEPSSAEQDVTFQLTNNGELEVIAEGYPTLRYQTDRITRLVVLDREGMGHLEISEKVELPYELAGNGPVAYDDSASLGGEKSVVVEVLSNDLAGPAPLDLSSVQVTTEPRHGVVKIDRETGALIYQAGPHGPQVEHDELWYTVQDELGNVSTARRVRVQL